MVRKACIVGNSVRNTGKECNISMGPTAMIVAVPPDLTFKLSDLDDIVTWAEVKIHADAAARIYPLFGYKSPINNIKNNPEADVVITLDDGTPVFVRYGMYNRQFETTAGGICYARELAGFLNSGMNVIEIDGQGQGLICDTGTVDDSGNKLYRGLIPSIMYGLSPQLADNKSTVYMNRLQYSFNPGEMINNGEIVTGLAPMLAMMGLIDTELYSGAAATTDTLTIGVRTECAQTEIGSKFKATPAVGDFIITDKEDGTIVTPTSVSRTGNLITFTDTGGFVVGHTYHVVGASPSAWYADEVIGYDGSQFGVDILVAA